LAKGGGGEEFSACTGHGALWPGDRGGLPGGHHGEGRVVNSTRSLRGRTLRFRAIATDDSAVALVEFSLVIPVVLLTFLALLQYLVVVQTAQLVNYAAYAAARVYAVRAAVDGAEAAAGKAKKAAALVLSPVGRLAPGELFGFGGSATQLLPDDSPQVLKSFVKLGEGYVVANWLRLSSAGGGSVTITTNTAAGLTQIRVDVSYPQPIYMPGLTELWTLVSGEKGIHRSLKPLREGLGGTVAAVDTLAEGAEAIQDFLYASKGNYKAITMVFPYMNVRGRCAIGFEDWGSKNPEYRPRLPKTVKGGEAKDPELDEKAKAMDQARKDYEAAQDRSNKVCKDYQNAHDARVKAEDAVAKTQPDTQERRTAELQLELARNLEAQKETQCKQAKADVQEKADKLDQMTK
jgi:hypothetical protein